VINGVVVDAKLFVRLYRAVGPTGISASQNKDRVVRNAIIADDVVDVAFIVG